MADEMAMIITSTPQLPFEIPHIPTNRDQKALIRGTLGGLGIFIDNNSDKNSSKNHRNNNVDKKKNNVRVTTRGTWDK